MTRAAIAEDRPADPAGTATCNTRFWPPQSNRSWHIAATEMRRPDVHLYALNAAPNDHCWPHATDAELHAENG